MKRIFLLPAEEEMLDAAAFYEARTPGLGLDFLDEVERVIESILKRPRLGVAVS